MVTGQLNGVLQKLRKAMRLREGTGQTDRHLLKDYLCRRDEAALAALVVRHGPMVWGVCRRLLRNYHDAEDAFQATFLVLVRRAASIASPDLLANWLYGVAHQTAMKARATAHKRNVREKQVAGMPDPAAVDHEPWNDLQPLLDQELSRLPEISRVVLVLCDLQGKTRKEAAQHLGLPEGTVASRLARARVILAKRLAQRGVVLSSAALAAVLLQNAALAGVPDSVMVNAVRSASLFAAGQTAAAGGITPKVVDLADGVLKAMMISKLKAVVASLLVLGFTVTGATILTCHTAAEQSATPAPAVGTQQAKTPQTPKTEVFTAWGKEVSGLQAGLGYDAGQKRAYRHGETVRLVLRVRNVSKKEVEFVCCRQYFMEVSPTMTDGQGKSVRLPANAYTPKPRQEKVSLAPGKEIELYELKFKLRPAGENGDEDNDTEFADFAGTVFTFYGTGKFLIRYERLIEKPWAGSESDAVLSKLATGKLELEIKADPPPASEKNGNEPDKDAEKERQKLLPRGPYATTPIGPDVVPSDPKNLEKWTQGKGVVDVCFAGPWQDPLKLRSSLKTQVPETDRDFQLTCGEGGGENRAFVQVSMTVTPEHVRRLLALQAELKPRGYLLDPKETIVWSYPVDSKLSQQIQTLVPQFREAVERELKKHLPKVQCHLDRNRFLKYEVPGTKVRGFVDVHEIRPGAPNTDVAVRPEEELHLPHLGLWIRLYYSGGSDEDAATHDAIRKVFRQAVVPFLKLESGAVVRNCNDKGREPSRK